MTKLVELGRVVAREQDAAYRRRPRDERAVERFVDGVELLPERAAFRSRVAAGVAAVALAAAVVLGLLRWKELAGSDERTAVPVAGQPFVVGNGKTVPLSFPDGSSVVLASGTEAVVHELNGTGANLEVSRGEAVIAVRHQDKTKWVIGAGPYRVRVTGTRFSMAWAPERERFELRLQQGSVVVTADKSSHSITMLAPETLVIDRGHWQVSPSVAGDVVKTAPAHELASALPPVAGPAAQLPAADDAPGSAVAALPPAGAPSPSPSPLAPGVTSWETLVRSGKYAAAYAEASRHGIAQLADSRPSSSLLSLAEGCRFSGHAADATRVLTRLRARFPGSDDAATAAFQLGRFAGDAAAVTWFRTYLQERPNGALAREAAGRLLEAESRTGDQAGARRAAEAYLQRYPNGTHAEFARQLLRR